ncbi:hypothetical protein Tco_0956465, partial [Tanacetum coccineum]
ALLGTGLLALEVGFTPVDRGNWVDLTQLARLGGGIYLEPTLYIPGASTLGVSEVEGPLLVLPVTWACSFVCSAVKALSFSVYAVREFVGRTVADSSTERLKRATTYDFRRFDLSLLSRSSTRTASIRKSDTSVLEDLKALSWKTCQEGSLLNLSDHRPYHEGFGAFAWQIPILVMISKTVLRHAKLFEGALRLTFAKRSEKHVVNFLPKVITLIEGWHEWFFYVQDSIIPAKYSQILSEQNKLDSKSFKDKLPPNIEENPMFHRLGRYPTSVRVFPDPILFLAGLKPSWEYEVAFRTFIYTEDDEDLSVLPKEPSSGFDTGSPSVSVNTEPLKADEKLVIQPAKVTTDSRKSSKPELFVVHPGSVASRIKDRKCKTSGGSSRPPIKRKLAPGSLTSCATRAKTYSLKDDSLLDSLPDVLKLKDATACHLKISAIIWTTIWMRSRELLQVIKKLRGKFDVMKDREKAKEEECEELRAKCEADMTEFEKNPISLSTLESKVNSLEAEKARLGDVEVSLRKEVEELKQDRREVVSKVIPYAAIELVHSHDMGSLVGRIVSFAILYGSCRAYEQVADMKEPFDLSKVKGYLSSYKKDHTQANNDLATVTFPWLDKFVADPSASIVALLSTKPLSLQIPAPSRTQVSLLSSQRPTPSSVAVSNPLSPLADVFVVKQQSSQLQWRRISYANPKSRLHGEHSLQSCLRIWRTLSLNPLCASSSGGSCAALNL